MTKFSWKKFNRLAKKLGKEYSKYPNLKSEFLYLSKSLYYKKNGIFVEVRECNKDE